MSVLIKIENLSIFAKVESAKVGSAKTEGADSKDTLLVEGLSLEVFQDRPLTILGETGAGKSLLAQAIMGLLPEGLYATGKVWLYGQLLDDLSADAMRGFWGKQMVMLPQEPWNSLDPLMQSGQQVAEVHELVHGLAPHLASEKAYDELTELDLEASYFKRSGQLSGGMAQRVAISAATAGGANLILADEPTKGLDVNRRDTVVDLLLKRSAGGALLTITHDVDVAKQIGGDLMVMKKGLLVEQGSCEDILATPKHDYTQALINADPSQWQASASQTSQAKSPQDEILAVENLTLRRGNQQLFQNLSFNLHKGEVLGVVGDSGSGKSSLGDIILGLLPYQKGQIKRTVNSTKASNSAGAGNHQWLKLFQDPPSAFSKAVTLGTLLEDLVELHHIDRSRISPLMARLKLPEQILTRFCTEVSGGELQRFAILRALLLDPVFLFADEPTSRLDPITAQEVINLLIELAQEQGCGVLLVSHHPELVNKVCDRVITIAA
ncbi:ABC transporter ATP-binding protein [Thalassotalea sp. PLHSN55]|uniref:ABC transporter ATP-binding protein n=1 Tax=Thalassotalea sp. PLHSN55 TaxID=3435888 RepID=UPI003F82A39C